MPKNGQFWRFFWKPCGQTVLPDRSILIGQKLVKNAKMESFKCDVFWWFSNTVPESSNECPCKN